MSIVVCLIVVLVNKVHSFRWVSSQRMNCLHHEHGVKLSLFLICVNFSSTPFAMVIIKPSRCFDCGVSWLPKVWTCVIVLKHFDSAMYCLIVLLHSSHHSWGTPPSMIEFKIVRPNNLTIRALYFNNFCDISLSILNDMVYHMHPPFQNCYFMFNGYILMHDCCQQFVSFWWFIYARFSFCIIWRCHYQIDGLWLLW